MRAKKAKMRKNGLELVAYICNHALPHSPQYHASTSTFELSRRETTDNFHVDTRSPDDKAQCCTRSAGYWTKICSVPRGAPMPSDQNKKRQGLSDDACFSEERRMRRAEWKDKIRNRTRGVL